MSTAPAGGLTAASGTTAFKLIKSDRPGRELSMKEIKFYGFPQKDQERDVREWKLENIPNLMRGVRKVVAARTLGLPHFYGQLWLRILKESGQEIDLGLVSARVVTTTGVGFIVDAFQNITELENMKFHGLGTGTTAEAAGDTALVSELTSQYNPDSTRATGTTTEGATGNIYRTVATNTVDASVAITEHGIFSQAATGGGVLLDRSVFSAVNLASGDSLQSTYELTFSAGG